MLILDLPIRLKDIYPTCKDRDNPMLGMNWYEKASKFKGGGRNSKANITKQKLHRMILQHKDEIREHADEEFQADWDGEEYGYHAHYDVYLGRDATDGHNVRAVMENFVKEGLDIADIAPLTTKVFTQQDGQEVRAVMEKFTLDALEAAELIGNDRFVFTTSMRTMLNQDNDGIRVAIWRYPSKYEIYNQRGKDRLPIPDIRIGEYEFKGEGATT